MIAKLCCAGSAFRAEFSILELILKRTVLAVILLLMGTANALRAANIPAFAPPDGGWTYLYSGNAVSNSLAAALDGSWNHLNGSDAWSGDGRGAGVGLPGGVSTSNGIVTIEDAVSPGASGNDNRRFYFTRNISSDPGVTNANTLLNDGVTLSFRARLTPASDPLIELTNAPNGFVNVNDGKGMFGIRQAGSNGMAISFSLNQATEDTSLTTSFNFASAGLHMNNLNGDVRSANVDPGEGGTINLLSLDPTAFHEFWITIQDNGANPGTHRVTVYVDGVLTPNIFNVTAGSGSEGPSTNYLALGLPSSPQRGAMDVDFFSYKPGVIIPIGADALPAITLQPANTTVLEGETASFNVGVTGAPPFSFQWYKNGLPIANATNRSLTTAPVGTNDHLAQFVAVVSNANGSATSAPPAVLSVTPDTTPPTVVSVGSLDGGTIGICFSEKVTAASAQNTGNYVVNGGAVPVSAATLRSSDGGLSVILTVTGLSSNSGTPFSVAASNIRDLASAGNLGGGSVTGQVMGLTAVDIGSPGTDPVVAGSTFVCAPQQLELLAGGSDLGGTSDAFHFVFQQRTGDFDVAMRVARLDPADRLTKGALVARETLGGSSRSLNVFAAPPAVPAADGSGLGANFYQSEYRTTTGGTAVEWPPAAHVAGVPYPNAWMRLIRQGNTFISYYGTNGIDWVQLGQVTDTYASTLYVGAAACAHTNAIGRSTTAVFQNFAFAPAPQILSQPQSQMITNGDSVLLSVSATGVGILRYQWRFNGNDIVGATNQTFTIASATAANGGTYTVTVANSGGVTESAGATFLVRLFDYGDAPNSYGTLRASNGARHLLGSGVYLGAGVDVDLDGIPGSNADGDDLSGTDDEDGIRFVTPLIAGQSALIEAVASTNGLLNAWIDWNGNGTFADSGEQVFTNQSLATGTNSLQIAVPHGATPALTFARFRFSTTSFLSFVGPAADGEVEDYAVTPQARSDLFASLAASPNPVAVGSNLIFSVNVTNLGPSTATGVSLVCQVQGALTFGTIVPSKGTCGRSGDTITCAPGSLLEGETMAVQVAVTPQTTGTITALLQATALETDPVAGNNSASASIPVEVPPSFVTAPTSLTVTQGNSATFTAAVQGSDPLGFRWARNGATLIGETGSSLFITNAQVSQEGAYTVQVTNRVGSIISAPAHLTVLAPPTIAQQPQGGTNYAGRTVSLSVLAGGTPPFSYQWYSNQTIAISGATNASLVFSNAQKTQTGDYSVVVSNAAGLVISDLARIVIVEADFADAPDTYRTTLASNGARHLLKPGMRLGTQIDFEPDGQPNSSATGDDLNGQNDDDGVVFPAPLYVGQAATVRVVASTNGLLNAWIDMQANGTWDEPSDQILTNAPLSAGTNLLSFRLSASAMASATFARFRFSTASNLTTFGEAPDGEVEDYRVSILSAGDLSLFIPPHANAVQMGTDITYSIVISNSGPSMVHGVVLTDALPTNVWLLAETPSQGSCLVSNGIVTCALADLAVGAKASVDFLMRPLSPGSYTNFFAVQGVENDPVPVNNQLVDIRIVQDPPLILNQPVGRAATNGDNVLLSVTASGSDLRYRWTRNGGVVAGATNASLVLSNIQSGQAGSYSVVVSNLVGQVVSDPAVVSVFTPLRITSAPQSVTVLPGVTVTFTVDVVGNEPISYQWFFNGVAMMDATNASLQILNVRDAQAGEYVVRVNNSFSTVLSDPAVLTLYLPPHFLVSLQDTTNFAGTDANLSVEVSGSPPFNYQWYRDGTLLPAATNSSLSISNAQKINSGFYLVVVTNIAGSVASFARLTVLEVDFGDAPDGGYPTTMAFNGARHVIVPGVRLGSRIDFESDGQPDDNALGDDLTGGDEDGVSFSGLYLGQLATIQVTASTNGFLDAWLDFDQNGAWVDFGEQIFARQPLVTGTNLLSLRVPENAVLGSTFARFRFSTTGGLSYDGMALDGEVEDYHVTIAPGVDLDVLASDSPDPVLLGMPLTYNIFVTNHGPSTASAVVLQDLLPLNASVVAIVASQGTCSQTGQAILCELGDLVSETGVEVDVNIIPLATGILTNSVSAIAVEHDGKPLNNAVVQTSAVVLPAVSFLNETRVDVNDNGSAQTYPSTIFVSGLTATVYKVTVTLSNLTHSFPDDFDILLVGPGGQSVMLMSDVGGSSLINNVQVTLDDDALLTFPDNSLFISQTYKPANYGEQNDLFPSPAPAPPYGTQLSAFRGTDPNGPWSLFVVDDTTDDAGFIANGWGLTITTIDPLTDLGIQIVDLPHRVVIQSNLVYSLIVTNPSAGWSSGSIVRDVLPTGAQFVSATSDSGSCSNAAGEVRCSVGPIAPGNFRVVTVTVRPQQLGVISNWASVVGTELDLKTANNSSGIVSFSRLPVDLALSATPVGDPVRFGDNITYSFSVTNKGPNPATTTTFVDLLPQTTTLLSAISSQGGCSMDNGIVSCQLGTIPVGGNASVMVMVAPQSIRRITNNAVISADEVDFREIDNSVTMVSAVGLLSGFAGSGVNIPATGLPTPYPSTIFVSGLTSAVYKASVTISNLQDPAPEGLDILLTGPGGQSVLLMSDAGDNFPVSGVTLTFSDDAPRFVPDGGQLTSGTFAPTNYVSGNEALPAPAPPGPFGSGLTVFRDTDPNGTWALYLFDRGLPHSAGSLEGWNLSLTTLEPIADLRLSSFAQPEPVAAGSNFLMTIQVSNAGPATASGIVLSNQVMIGSPAASIALLQGSCTNLDGVLVCQVPNLSAGTSASILLSVSASGPGVFGMTSSVMAQERDLRVANNTITKSVVVELPPVVTTPPVDLVVTNGDSAQFSVEAAGTGPFFFSWRRNGSPLPNQTNGLLLLSNVGLPDAGAYSVQVSNRVGSVLSPQALLVVKMRPVINPIADQSFDEDTTAVIPMVVGDFETPAASLQLATRSSDQLLLSDTSISIGGVGSNRFLTLTPATNRFGNATIIVSVTDGDGISSTNSFGITIRPVNDAPTISFIANQVTDEDTPTGLLNFTISDVDGLAGLSVTASSSNTGLVANARIVLGGSGGDRNVVITPERDQSGVTTITLTVRDSQGASAATTFDLRVNPVNDPPTIDLPADLVISEDAGAQSLTITGISSGAANEVQLLSLSVSNSNPDLLTNLILSYTSPATTAVLNWGTVSNRFGNATLNLTLTEDGSNAVQQSFQVIVNPVNDLPLMSTIADQRLELNTSSGPIAFTIGDLETSANDLVVSVNTSAPGVIPVSVVQVTGSGSNRFVAVTAGNQIGDAELTVVVTDGDGGSVSNRFSVTVFAIAPQITSDPQNVTVTNGGFVTFTVSATGTQPTFQWRHDGADLTGKTNSTLILPSASAADAGSYDVRVSNAAGTILSSNAVLRVLVTPTITGVERDPSGITLRLTSMTGLNYILESSLSLKDPIWESVVSRSGTGSEITLLDPSVPVPKKFYRVRVQ